MTPRPTLRILATLFTMTVVSSCGGSDGGPTTGDLVVVVSTTGTAQDPDGYSVTVTGATPISATDNDTVAVPDLSSGAHDVQLTGIASTCAGGSVVHTNVPAGGADTVAFAVTCTATTGTLAVRVATTGVALDPDGYQVAIDGGAASTVAVNGATTATTVPVGAHSVTLSGIAMNCSPSVAGPYPVSIAPAEADTLSLGLSCQWPAIAVRLGSGGIALINPDGSNEQDLVPDTLGLDHQHPALSIDRSKIAVDRLLSFGAPQRVIGIVDPDSAPTISILPESLSVVEPRWRPDGTAILEIGPDSVAGSYRLFTQPLPGGGRTRVGPDSLIVWSADWSPDGTQIAFVGSSQGHPPHIFKMQANGSGLVQITPDSVAYVSFVRWSPAGDRILFDGAGTWSIAPDGSGLQQIVISGYTLSGTASWSPDGSAIVSAAVNTVSGAYRFLRIDPAGTILATLTRPGGGAWWDPDWR